MNFVVNARRGRLAACAAVQVATLALFVASAAARGKPHCRDLTFDGAAGAGSQDKVSLRVVDALGNVIEESCKIQVKPNESHTAFAGRMPGAWGDGAGFLCGDDSATLKSTCGNGFGRSCRHRFIFQQRKDGTIKREAVRVCCFESPDCRGRRLGKTDPSVLPISIQAKVDPDLLFSPAVPPVVGITIIPVALDPIGMTQQPHAELKSCRFEIGKAMRSVVAVMRAMIACEHDVLSGRLEEGTDCTSGEDLRVETALAAFEQRLSGATDLYCAESGQPADFGYLDCPVPCEDTAVDTWSGVAACAACVAQDAAATAVLDKYGDPGPAAGLPLPVRRCQAAIGSALLNMVQTDVNEVLLCQHGTDTATKSLPEGVSDCKSADLSGRRAAGEAAVAQQLSNACDDEVIPALDTCGADVADEIACVIDNANTVAGAVADAAFPEGRE